MPTYTVFEVSEAESPLATLQLLAQAFEMACARAGFTTKWTRDGATTTCTFIDKTKKSREIAPRSAVHPDAFEARREVMKEALSEGIWGYHAEPDANYRAEMDRSAEYERRQRQALSDAMREKVVPITVTRDGGFPAVDCVGPNGEPVWKGNSES